VSGRGSVHPRACTRRASSSCTTPRPRCSCGTCTEVLRGDVDVRDALYTVNTEPRFRALPSGNHIADPAGALGGRAFKNLVDSLAEPRYFVVVDTPPAGPFVDALNVASQCDATVFVLDVKTSRRRSARRTIESLQRSGANIRGVVVNRISSRQSTYYDYYYTKT